jgi:serine/threonine-protein kinase
VGATADIYSIGVMLYEMLSGRLPFEGDSAVSVALKHLSEPPTPISHLRPDVNPALESVVMAALAKDPAHRWQSAEDFAEGLRAARAHLDAGVPAGTNTAEFAPVTAPVAPNGGAPPAPPHRDEDRGRNWPWFTIGLLALALLALLAFLAADGLLAPDKKEVPDVVGKQLIQARQQLERAGFEVQTERVQSRAEFDQVLDQDPNAGEEAEKGSTITLEVSRGPGNVLVPTVAGLPREQALKELQKADLKVSVEERSSDDIREGYALRTTPEAGRQVVKGSRVTLFVSTGPEQVAVPDVTGISRESAEDSLRAEGLKVVVREEPSDTPEGEVVSQDPAAGTEVDAGSRVTITVSTGPEQVAVPDVIGLSAAEARRALRDAGLKAEERSAAVTDPNQDGVVTDQSPDAGGEVDKGGSVVIFVGELDTDTLDQPDGTAAP